MSDYAIYNFWVEFENSLTDMYIIQLYDGYIDRKVTYLFLKRHPVQFLPDNITRGNEVIS